MVKEKAKSLSLVYFLMDPNFKIPCYLSCVLCQNGGGDGCLGHLVFLYLCSHKLANPTTCKVRAELDTEFYYTKIPT